MKRRSDRGKLAGSRHGVKPHFSLFPRKRGHTAAHKGHTSSRKISFLRLCYAGPGNWIRTCLARPPTYPQMVNLSELFSRPLLRRQTQLNERLSVRTKTNLCHWTNPASCPTSDTLHPTQLARCLYLIQHSPPQGSKNFPWSLKPQLSHSSRSTSVRSIWKTPVHG